MSQKSDCSLSLHLLVTKWRREVKYFGLTFTKAIAVLLFWQFSTSLIYSSWLVPSSLLHVADPGPLLLLSAGVSLIFLLSPVAGYLADVKFGRFKVLLYNTYFISVCMIFLLVLSFLCYGTHPHHNYVLIIPLILVLILFCVGKVFFVANIVQFGTDQLRDFPTECSVLFFYAFLWCYNFSNVLTFGSYVPSHNTYFSISKELTMIDSAGLIFITTTLGVAILSSWIVICILHKKKNWFFIENIRGNPYKLVTNVILFALRHKEPIRRSAFTYCENEPPSRIDFGKSRYGGPYTTEQVEDVKVLINIVKLLVSLGPVFLIDMAAILSSNNQPHQYNSSYSLEVLLMDYRMLTPLFTVICIPFYLVLLKPILARFIPIFFKRIGLSIIVLIISFLLYLLYDTLAYDAGNELGHMLRHCSSNTSYILNRSLVYISPTYMLVLQPILMSISHMLLYIGAWEFICCQSPQQMKGLLFGLFFAIRAFFQFVGTLEFALFTFYLKSNVISCRTGYYFFNLCVAVASLVIYTAVARRYKYRKRDDICNVYKFAEDYYSK